MTASLEKQLREDRAMRDEALALVKADVDHLKADYSDKGLGERAADKLKGGANGIYGEALEVASEHRGLVAAAAAALFLWFARHPIMAFLFGSDDDDADNDEDYRERRTQFH